tara:strand:+ start:89 stop:316 length:228 start_codon:yes stop_codon:yes gene_type:complete
MSTFGSGKKAMKKTMKTFNKAYKQIDPRDLVSPKMPTNKSLMARNRPTTYSSIKFQKNPAGKIFKMVQQLRSTDL